MVFACGHAMAAGYDDFAHGVSANNIGDSDAAIAFFTSALSAGDLSPALQPVAHLGRGSAYLRKGKCTDAASDAAAAIAAKPDLWDAKALHAAASACLGQFDAALADYAAVLAVRPSFGSWFARGLIHWRTGDFAAAAADLRQAARLEPKHAYNALWLALVSARGGAPDEAGARAAIDRIDSDDWPAPLLALYADLAKPEDVDARAAKGSGVSLIGQRCEADFYIAEWRLAHNDSAGAKPLLENAVAHCPRDFIERDSARFELTRVK